MDEYVIIGLILATPTKDIPATHQVIGLLQRFGR